MLMLFGIIILLGMSLFLFLNLLISEESVKNGRIASTLFYSLLSTQRS